MHYWMPAFILVVLAGTISVACMTRALRRERRQNAELRASEARHRQEASLLRLSLENLGEGLSVFGPDGELLLFNSRFTELLGLPDEVLSSGSLYKILEFQTNRGDFGSDASAISVQQRLERAFQNLPMVRERLTREGKTLQIRRREMPGGIVSLYSDITEAKLLERRMTQARDEAEQANRAKSEFLANMSHELRTPLNAIVGFAELVSSELFGPMGQQRYLEYVKDIHSSGLHLLSVINEILDMAKIEAGKLDLSIQRFSITQVVNDALRMLRDQANKRNVDLFVTFSEREIDTFGDERAIKQAFLNIVSNAIKFSHDNGKIEIRVQRDARHGIILEVEDQGIGMSEAALKRAMQPFEQAASSTTKTYGGTGLGLPIANGLVEAHGGKLTIESCEGEGTRVRIELPLQPGRGQPETSVQASRNAEAAN